MAGVAFAPGCDEECWYWCWPRSCVPAAPAIGSGTAKSGVDLGGVFGHAIASATSSDLGRRFSWTWQVEADDDASRGRPPHRTRRHPGDDPSSFEGRRGIRHHEPRFARPTTWWSSKRSRDPVASQSQPLRLTDLGVDPALVGVLTVPPIDDEEFSDSTRQWGWAGLGLAAVALTLVALWALPDRRRRGTSGRGVGEGSKRKRTRPCRRPRRRSRIPQPPLTPTTTKTRSGPKPRFGATSWGPGTVWSRQNRNRGGLRGRGLARNPVMM